MIERKRSTANQDRNAWMTTYSDMVTLLLAFFVIMFSFSSVNVEKFQQLLGSVQTALGVNLNVKIGGAPLPPVDNLDELALDAQALLKQQDFEQLETVRSRLEKKLTDRLPGISVELVTEERGLVLRFADSVLFDSGQAVLKPEAKSILELFSQEVASFPNHIRIEGHTDSKPISTLRFPSNWELSTARATQVIRYLLSLSDIPPERLSAAGYGEHRPVATNETPEGRTLNRRVDLVILRLSLGGGEPK